MEQNSTSPAAVLYLRLSDARTEGALDGREEKLRARAAQLGWTVARVAVENDIDAEGRPLPASAFKQSKIVTPGGRVKRRVIRPVYRSVLDDLTDGRVSALLAEDLDRVTRDPRDLEDLIEACLERRASADSLSGSLRFTEGGTDSEVTMARVLVAMANKSSRDTARRVAGKRQTQAVDGWYGGGRRPYGYRPDPTAAKYHRTLLIVDSEAQVIRDAAHDILHGVSLASIAPVTA